MGATIKYPDTGTLLTEEALKSLLLENNKENNKVLLAAIEVLIKNNTGPVVPPVPELPKCKKGPVLGLVTKKSPQRLQSVFDGEDVFEIYASVKKPDGTNILKDVLSSKTNRTLQVTGKAIGTFAPDSNDPLLALSESLVAGVTYTVKFTATLCKGESEKPFFFDDTVIPPPDPGKPCNPSGKIIKIELTNR